MKTKPQFQFRIVTVQWRLRILHQCLSKCDLVTSGPTFWGLWNKSNVHIPFWKWCLSWTNIMSLMIQMTVRTDTNLPSPPYPHTLLSLKNKILQWNTFNSLLNSRPNSPLGKEFKQQVKKKRKQNNNKKTCPSRV